MSVTEKATKAAEELLIKLEGQTEENEIREICMATMDALFEGKIVRRALDILRKTVKENYPEIPIESNQKPPANYYYCNTGKGRKQRFEHLALWYLSDSGDKVSHFEIVGDKARKAYWSNLPILETPDIEITQQKEETMTIQKVFEMDSEMSEIAAKAMEQLNISLEEFAKRAFKYYAQSVTGKTQQKAEDLAGVSTEDLLNNKKYKSHPNRAEELTNRAIRAIKLYNESQGESADKWAITPSIIHELIGSKPATIKAILATNPDIKGYHFNIFGTEEPPLTHNRKKHKITEVINLAELVPDGYTE